MNLAEKINQLKSLIRKELSVDLRKKAVDVWLWDRKLINGHQIDLETDDLLAAHMSLTEASKVLNKFKIDKAINSYEVFYNSLEKKRVVLIRVIVTNLTYFSDAEPIANRRKYWVDKKQKEIWINNKYLLSRPHFNHENELVFEYAFAHPDTTITKKELENAQKSKISKSFSKIINELGFVGTIRKAFFPKVSGKSAICFRKTLTSEALESEKINENLLIKELEVAHTRHNPK